MNRTTAVHPSSSIHPTPPANTLFIRGRIAGARRNRSGDGFGMIDAIGSTKIATTIAAIGSKSKQK